MTIDLSKSANHLVKQKKISFSHENWAFPKHCMPPKSRILFLKKKWIIIHCVSSKGFNPRWSREGGGQLVTASGAPRRWDCCRWRVWHEQNSTHIMASSRDLCRGMPTMFGLDCDCRESVIKLGDAMAGDVVFFWAGGLWDHRCYDRWGEVS